MVGRLVEQQQVGAAHQRLREIEAHPPAAGKARDRLACRAARKAQARRAASRRARARRSRRSPRSDDAARRAARRRRADRRPRGFGVAQRALDLAQLAIAVEHVVDRRRRRRPASPARRARSSTPAAARRRPRRATSSPRSSANRLDLPLPLAPISPTLWPGVHGERRAFEQALGAAGEREVA